MRAERAVLLSLVYLAVALYIASVAYLNIIYGVKFPGSMATSWLQASLVSYIVSATVNSSLTQALKAVLSITRAVMRRNASVVYGLKVNEITSEHMRSEVTAVSTESSSDGGSNGRLLGQLPRSDAAPNDGANTAKVSAVAAVPQGSAASGAGQTGDGIGVSGAGAGAGSGGDRGHSPTVSAKLAFASPTFPPRDTDIGVATVEFAHPNLSTSTSNSSDVLEGAVSLFASTDQVDMHSPVAASRLHRLSTSRADHGATANGTESPPAPGQVTPSMPSPTSSGTQPVDSVTALLEDAVAGLTTDDLVQPPRSGVSPVSASRSSSAGRD